MSNATRRVPSRMIAVTAVLVAALVAALVAGIALVVRPWQQSDSAAGLTPALAHAVDQASERASEDGVRLRITSGARTEAEQDDLWREALVRYGSPEAARQQVLPPEESAHVRGEAIDVDGPSADWIEEHGWRYGLCIPYWNEWWHVELRTEPGQPCPAKKPDPSHALE